MNKNSEIEIVQKLLEDKKYEVINEYVKMAYLQDKPEIVFSESFTDDVYLCKENDKIQLYVPKEMDWMQESHVAKAIVNGTIFDDADDVERNAMVIERKTIPYDAMINRGKPVPKHIKPMIAIIIGKMDENGSFAVDDADRCNAVNFVKDLTTCHHGHNHSVNDVLKHHIGVTGCRGTLSPELGKKAFLISKEVKEINDTKPEDVISSSDVVDSYDDYDMDDIEKDYDHMYDDEEDDESDEADTVDTVDEVEDEYETDEADEVEDEYEEEYATFNTDDDVYTEGVIDIIKNMFTIKKLGYDKKTKTFITDIDFSKFDKAKVTKMILKENFDYYEIKKIEESHSEINLIFPIDEKTNKFKCPIKFSDNPTSFNWSAIPKEIKGSIRNKIINNMSEFIAPYKIDIHMDCWININKKDLTIPYNEFISVLKHEEGHYYMFLNGIKIKDTDNLIFFVNKDKKKRGAHDQMYEEHIADKYGATHGNAEGLISFFKKEIKLYEKYIGKINKEFDRVIINKINKIKDMIKSNKNPDQINKEIQKMNKLFKSLSSDYSLDTVGDVMKGISNSVYLALNFMASASSADLYNDRINGNYSYLSNKYFEEFNEKELEKTNEILLTYYSKYKNSSIGKEYKIYFDKNKNNNVELNNIGRNFNKMFKYLFENLSKFDDKTPISKYDDLIEYVNNIKKKCINECKAVIYGTKKRIEFIEKTSRIKQEAYSYMSDDDVYTESHELTDYEKYKIYQESKLTKRPKKLKPIPYNIVAYVKSEMNKVETENDKAALSGYICSKVELIDFYLTCIDTQDARYMVPHDRSYLIKLKNEIESLLTKTLNIRPINNNHQWRVSYSV